MISAENNYLKKIGYFFLFVLITIFLVGCKIEGNVSEKGQGVKDVTVHLTGTETSTTITQDSGNFKFNFLDNGEYIVSLSKTDYTFEPVSQKVVIESRFDVKTISFEAISNKIPIADPQNITLEEDSEISIVLTGSDQDNDPLTFIVQTNPEHGQLTGTAPDLIYTPSENYNGMDSFTFVANDGQNNSEPAVITIEITPVIDPPTVTLSADPLTINPGGSSTLTWSSVDADSCTIEPGIGNVNLNGSTTVSPSQTTTYTITASNSEGTVIDTAEVTILDPPIVTLSANPLSINKGGTSTLTWTSTNADSCSIGPDIGDVELNGSVAVTIQETTIYTITASNADGSSTSSVEITIKVPPAVHLSVSEAIINHGESVILTWNSSPAQKAYFNNEIGEVAPSGSMTLTPEYTTTYTITSVNDTLTSVHSISVKVLGNPPEPQPEGTFGEQYNDLIPSDASLESYDPDRFIVLTGFVEDISGNPVQNVKVEIIDHPEYGSALSDNTGRFSIPAEGGTLIKISYKKDDYLTLHRRKAVPVKDIVTIDTVTILQRDSAETLVTFDGNPNTVITHKSTEFTDESGPRSCTMVFTGDTKAYELDKYGNRVKELTSITTRATEYITPKAMPSILPSNVAFTYCAELEADGIARIEFDRPVINYVDNFLGFDVGEIVPVGYYDRDLAEWVGSDNGVVVRLLDTNSDGIVDALDATGDDSPDDLNNDGSTTDEVIGMDSSYQPGKTYWRFKTKHFTPWDCNWPSGPPLGAIVPNPPTKPNTGDDKPCFITGTLVHTDKGLKPIEDVKKGDLVWSKDEKTSKMLLQKVTKTIITPDHEIYELKISDVNEKTITIGTTVDHPFWVKGKGWIPAIDLKPGDKTTTIKNRLETIIDSKKGLSKKTVYNLEVENFHTYFVGKSGYLVHNTCAGKIDHRARVLNESVPIQGTGMTLHYSSDRVKAYKTIIDVPVSGDSIPSSLKRIIVKCEIAGVIMERILDPLPDQKEIFLWDGLDYNGKVVTTTVSANISIGFVYDFVYYSPGDNDKAWAQMGVTPTFTRGRQNITFWQNDLIKINSQKNKQGNNKDIANGWTVSPHHNLNLDDPNILHKGDGTKIENNSLIITTVAGNYVGVGHYSGDGGPAIEAHLYSPLDISTDKNGNLFIADHYSNRIRKVNTNGIITTIAGTTGYIYDGVPAIESSVGYPTGVATDSFGNLFFAHTDRSTSRGDLIRMVDTNGIITTVSGIKTASGGSFDGDGKPATEVDLQDIEDVANDKHGNLFIAISGDHRICKIDTNGIITTIAGTGERGYSGDGGPATEAKLLGMKEIALDQLGNLYIADNGYHCIRKVDTSGIITTVAGTGEEGFSGDGGLAT
ncbi:MAG: cadherin-like domain-containing protein, partial [Desulfobacteraceae bacterium]|nr:cadherin-like domain-containing protein [Desulfobacteraceae bacterium]